MCVKLVCSKEANDGGAVHIKYRNNQTLWKMCHASFQMVTIPITYNILFPGGGGWRSSASWRRRRGSPPPGTRSSPSGSSMGSWYSAACRALFLDFQTLFKRWCFFWRQLWSSKRTTMLVFGSPPSLSLPSYPLLLRYALSWSLSLILSMS